MKKRPFFILIIVIIFFSCSEKDADCAGDNPLEEITWLKEWTDTLTTCSCEASVFQAEYEEQTVFYGSITDPACEYVFYINLYDCEENLVKTYGPEYDDFSIFEKEVTNRKLLHTCPRPDLSQ